MALETLTTDTSVIERDIQQEIGNSIEEAGILAINIKNNTGRAEAVMFGSSIQSKINRLKAKREDIVPPLRKAYEKIRDFFDEAVRPLEAAKKALAQAVSVYDIEMERKQRIEQEKIEAENRRKQEEYENRKKAWELEQIREREAKIKEEENTRLAHAEEAQIQGNVHKVDSILDKTTAIAPNAPQMPRIEPEALKGTNMPPPMIPPIIAKKPDENTISRDIWKFDIENIIDLAKAVIENKAPIEYLLANESTISKDIRRLKNEFRCPGIKIWKERSTSFRG